MNWTVLSDRNFCILIDSFVRQMLLLSVRVLSRLMQRVSEKQLSFKASSWINLSPLPSIYTRIFWLFRLALRCKK